MLAVIKKLNAEKQQYEARLQEIQQSKNAYADANKILNEKKKELENKSSLIEQLYAEKYSDIGRNDGVKPAAIQNIEALIETNKSDVEALDLQSKEIEDAILRINRQLEQLNTKLAQEQAPIFDINKSINAKPNSESNMHVLFNLKSILISPNNREESFSEVTQFTPD